MKTLLLLAMAIVAAMSVTAQTTKVAVTTTEKINLHKLMLVEMTADHLSFSEAAETTLDSASNSSDMRILFTIKDFANHLTTGQQEQFCKALQQFIKEQQVKLANENKVVTPSNNAVLNEDDFQLDYL